MSNELLTMQSIHKIINVVTVMLDHAFPGDAIKVGVLQGERPFIDPWFLHISSEDPRYHIRKPIEVKMDVRTMLEHADYAGGIQTASGYASGIFQGTIAMMAEAQPDPEAFLREVRMRMQETLGGTVDASTGSGEPAGGLILP